MVDGPSITDWITAVGTFGGVVVAGFATFYAFKYSKKQTEIFDFQTRIYAEQTRIFSEQNKIFAKQSEIATNQIELTQMQIRAELYERQFLVYEELQTFLGSPHLDSTTDTNQNLQLLLKSFHLRQRASFLFKSDVTNFIDEIFGWAWKVRENRKLHSCQNYVNMSAAESEKEFMDLCIKLYGASNRSYEIFSVYLKLYPNEANSINQSK